MYKNTHTADQIKRQRNDAGFAALLEQQLPFPSLRVLVDAAPPDLALQVRLLWPLRLVPPVQVIAAPEPGGGADVGGRVGHRHHRRDRPQRGRGQDDGQQHGQQHENGRGRGGDERRGRARRLAVVLVVGRRFRLVRRRRRPAASSRRHRRRWRDGVVAAGQAGGSDVVARRVSIGEAKKKTFLNFKYFFFYKKDEKDTVPRGFGIPSRWETPRFIR